MKAGAGGNWKRIDEKFDSSIIQQTSGISCLSAVGEMLLKNQGIFVSQAEIRDIIGEPSTASMLAFALNHFDISDGKNKWHGIVTDNEGVRFLLRQKNWSAILIEDYLLNKMGHAVLIDGKTPHNLIKIKDSFDQTSYKITEPEFFGYWGGEVVFYGKIK
jgi:Peptidase C39 family